ncbi:LOW QUALITY PROTEIN: transcriptional regulator ATRX homolog [Chelonus insularis]|uniref:LOW QUALITY PROTEIN: transcriptional regulator ATRX homolog n=1 Tax=Chelonus insularis TaxID=460826 RepID=UPI00158C99F1|nr:LOW QUALITY PROTEIN: transcriptional regulator ATRX homolog [Chelonus insularis]
MMSSATEKTTTKMKERQTENNKNSQEVKKIRTQPNENKNKKTKKEIIDLSSDSDSNFSPKNTKSQSKTNTKHKFKINKTDEKHNISSDDESSSDSQEKQKPNIRPKKSQKKQTVRNSQKNNLSTKQNAITRGDSTSSEKEFSKHKIIESYVCLQRISNIEKDRTPAANENKFDEDKNLTKNEAFLLKNNLQKLFQDLQNISTKLIYEIEHTRKTYYYKEQLRFSDATKAIIECKNILRNLKEKTSSCEKLLVDRYNNWCKKTNNINIFINNDGPDTPKRWKTPTINGTKKVISSSSSNNDSEEESEAKKEKLTKNVEKSSSNNGRKSPTEVSDCDGQEIFSADEMEKETDAVNLDEILIDPKIKQSIEKQSTYIKNKEKEKEDEISRSDSDATVFEQEVTTSVTSNNQTVEKTAKTTGESELNQSGDLFTDSDEDDKENPVSSEDKSKIVNHSFHSESSVTNRKSNSDKNDVQDPRNDITSNKNKLDSSSEEEDNIEKQVKERLLNSSSDSDRNELEDENINTKKKQLNSSPDSAEKKLKKKDNNIKNKLLDSSSDSDQNELKDEDTNIKKKLLDSSSDSDKNELKDEDTNIKKKLLDSSSDSDRNELEDDDTNIKKKLLDSSSDSDRNELEDDDTNIKKKLLDSSSDSNDNISTDNQSKNSLQSSINSTQEQTKNSNPKTSDPLLNITEKKSTNEENSERSMLITSESDTNTSDEDEVKNKLLNSSSDSDREEEKNTTNNKGQKKNNETHILNVSDENSEKQANKENTEKGISDTQATKNNEQTKIDRRLSNNGIEKSRLNELKQKNIEISDIDSETDNSNADSNKENINNLSEQKKELISDDSAEDENTVISKNSDNKKLKSRFTITKNKYYKHDQKLRTKCFVKIQRLSENILSQHSHTLQSSREYLETKQFHSLISLDQLEKKHHQRGNFVLSDEEDTTQLKIKKKQFNLPEETLLDHLGKVDSKENKDQNSHSDNSDTEVTSKKMNNLSFSEDFMKESDAFSKAKLLESSDSDVEIVGEHELGDSSDDKRKKKINTSKKSSRTTEDNDEEDKNSEQNDNQSEKTDKSDWKKSKVLTAKFLETDSEEENERAQKKLARTNSKRDDSDSDKSDNEVISKKKKTKRRRIVTSDDSDIKISSSSNSDSETEKNDKCKQKNDKKNTKRRRKSDSDSDAVKEITVKTKRKRIRAVVNDSDSSDNEHNSSQTSVNKGSGRKNIRKVLKDKQVALDTQEAAKQEEERLKRMAERQKLFNEMYETRLANEEKVDKLILDFDEESKEILLDVDKNLVKRLKPHQAKGIKFMWDACFESLERIKNTSGSGCILAHCMGLGKSFQVVTLAHTLLTHSEKTGVNTILIVAPLSTVLNWINEFKIWLTEVENGDDIELYELTKARTLFERKCQLDNWQRTGGILIIGYEMFRNLSSIKGKVRKSVQDAISKCIIDPGPDLIVCDEGHLLKNEDSAISKAIRKVRTLRRIVLTGTPLQNNLIEYHCMVQFVKPNLLGTKKEFSNRFVNPIQNGQFDDSTEYDVKIMKKRAHVLHKMLEGSVQRFDYSVLTPFLPPKQEYVILVKLTDVQRQMYQYYLDNFARKQTARAGGSLFVDFQGLHRIWTHPYVMKLHAENHERIMMKKREAASDSAGSLEDFIVDGSESDTSSSASDDSNKSDVIVLDDDDKPIKRSTRANPVKENTPPPLPEDEPIEQREWWSQFVKPEHYTDVRVSAKLLILLDILKEAEQIGDKVLVFSQSLYSLTLIEKFLEMIDDETQNSNELPSLDKHTGSWSLGLDYFRLDGQTSAENRSIWVRNFNKPNNTRARLFLISTRAGGLGINLTAANRVVIFDASWNPSHDVQSIFRIYRFGQKKPCYVYRLLAGGTMEEKIYNRQVTKLSLSCRVVDEYQIERHYSNHDLAELYRLEPPKSNTLGLPKDRLLAEIFLRHKDIVEAYHEHDSLLENIAEEELNDEERKQAWQEYEEEKAGRRQMPQISPNFNPKIMLYNNQMMDTTNINSLMNQGEHHKLLEMIKKDYPNLSETAQRELAYKALNNMYSYVENQFSAANHNYLPTMNVPSIPNMNSSNPSMTVANMLAQQEYNRAHNKFNQQQKQMQYAQQFGNNVGSSQSKPRPTTSTGKYSTNNGDKMETSTNSRGNFIQGSSEKRQEE